MWEEKLGLREPFAGNQATRHGNSFEATALADYERLSQHSVLSCGFRTLRDDDAHNWLGGSPDGLIEASALVPGRQADANEVCLH